MEILMIFAFIIFLWWYRKTGVLYYQIKHARAEDYNRSIPKVCLIPPPNFFLFLFNKITKFRFYWLIQKSSGIFLSDFKDPRQIKFLFRQYKEIYGWPFIMFFAGYKNLKFLIKVRLKAFRRA